MRFLLLTTLLLTAPVAFAQTAPTPPTDNPLLRGWAPNVDRLEQLRGDAISDAYSDRSVKGVYSNAWQREQRFTEHHTADGRVAYREGDFTAEGNWRVAGDVMCFDYDDIPNQDFCYSVFRYGACLITFSDQSPVLRGTPLAPGFWHSVQLVTDLDFRWPDREATPEDAFVCEAFVA